MNRIQKFFSRQHGISNDLCYDFALRRLCVAREDSWRGILPSNYSSDFNPEPPIFSAKFANCDGYRHILAIANEDGKIALQDTTLRNHETEERALTAPQCHYNAVFDLEWAPGQMRFVSASGDHTARLWEVDGGEIRNVRAFVGHTRSVKTAAFRKSDASVFATGGRDGAIIIWDTRANLNVDLTPRADNCIYSGHVGGPGTPVSQKKRTRTPKMAPNTTSSSITGLAFQDTNTLISCGAGDGIIKVWDLRRNYTAYKKEPHPKYSLPYAGSSTFKGFTNLLIDQSGARLFANCMDNTVYCYNICSYSPKVLARYKGLLNSTFYIKACLSPDGKYLLSGSSDEKAYIWNLDYPDEPLVALAGHTVEVTCVAWGSTHDCPIVTCSDDARHKIWRIGPEDLSASELADHYRGHAEYVRKFGLQHSQQGPTHKYNLRDLESTPRSLKRLVEQNERTPNSVEKLSSKRSFLEMLDASAMTGNDSTDLEHIEPKRSKLMEPRGRRLFSPSTSGVSCPSSNGGHSVHCVSPKLPAIPEDIDSISNTNNDSNQENAQTNVEAVRSSAGAVKSSCAPPLSRRLSGNLPPSDRASPPVTSQAQPMTSMIFSPTSNLPNYVLDGDAPHLGIMSPKRKHKDKVDWLTKIRKQKLMFSCRGATLTDKMNESHLSHNASESDNTVQTTTTTTTTTISIAASSRLQSLRQSEGSPRLSTSPRRRISYPAHSNDTLSPSTSSACPTHQPSAHHQPRTPTSSRRNSETTILRFFTIQTQQQQSAQEQNAVVRATERVGDMHSLSPLPASASASAIGASVRAHVHSHPASTAS